LNFIVLFYHLENEFTKIYFGMKKLLTIGLFCLSLSMFGQTPKDKQTILSILDRQTKAWNAGDINNFMKGYWETDSLMYIGKTGIKYGYKPTLENYKKNYPDKATMGNLKFEIIKVDFLGANFCSVVGKWNLTRPEKGDVSGHFTLLWKKIKNEWVIIADHSS
jgi:hypothetical protein